MRSGARLLSPGRAAASSQDAPTPPPVHSTSHPDVPPPAAPGLLPTERGAAPPFAFSVGASTGLRPPPIFIPDRCRRSGSGLPSRRSYRLQLLPAYRLRPFASSSQPTDTLVQVASSQSVELKMKWNGDIKSFFWNYEAAKRKNVAAEEQPEYEDALSNIEDEAVLPPPLVHFAEIEVDIEDEAFHSDAEVESDSEDEVASLQHPCARPYNIQRLPPDPGERIPISEYDVDDQDEVRRRYIAKQAVQPYAHNFQIRKICGKKRHFNFVWFETYKWLEYSVKYEATFFFVCYLFKGKSNGGPRGDALVNGG
ncbi:uncharacterized protein LOC119368948 [Triticum dicoccoides]|uniref:uncharacterized protein LOC119368948 n=1 Tax=Triticum dicoccoides TaxID=85692 RepID=UPI00188DF5B1|nr:uncharacterized protein LOC119368948 [Triticum dicoccoides]